MTLYVCFLISHDPALSLSCPLIRWGGSVLDSVVGTFLTQNASDVLSSRAFISLAARFPSARYRQGLSVLSGLPVGAEASQDGGVIDLTGQALVNRAINPPSGVGGDSIGMCVFL